MGASALLENMAEGAAQSKRWLDSCEPLLCGVLISGYLLLSVLVYSVWLGTWTPIDSVYFAVVTLTTVGYGDVTPHGEIPKVVTIFMQFIGVVIIGVAIGVLTEFIISQQELLADERDQQQQQQLLGSSATQSAPPARSPTIARKIWSIVWPIVAVAVVGAAVEWHVEGWSIHTSLYWAFTTVFTIGYGDHAPKFEGDKYFAVVYIPIAVTITSLSISNLSNLYIDLKKKQQHKQVLRRNLDESYLKVLDMNGDGSVNKYEFAMFMLKVMDKVDDKTIA